MTPNGRVREAVYQTAGKVVTTTPLFRLDRARRIDRVIDYFGGAGWRGGVGRATRHEKPPLRLLPCEAKSEGMSISSRPVRLYGEGRRPEGGVPRWLVTAD
jgi:hypothetical protein